MTTDKTFAHDKAVQTPEVTQHIAEHNGLNNATLAEVTGLSNSADRSPTAKFLPELKFSGEHVSQREPITDEKVGSDLGHTPRGE